MGPFFASLLILPQIRFLVLAAGDIGSKVLIIVSTAYIARTLGEAGFGQLVVPQAIVSYLVVFVDLGLGVVGLRSIAKDSHRAAFWTANVTTIRLLFGLAVFAVCVALPLLVSDWPIDRALWYASAIWLLPLALNIEWVFQGLQKTHWVSLSRIVREVLILGIVFLTVKNASNILQAANARWIGEALLRALFLGILIVVLFRTQPSWRLRPEKWTMMVRTAVPFGLSTVLINVYYGGLDAILLSHWYGAAVTGTYVAAYRLYVATLAVINVLRIVYDPMLARAAIEGNDQLQLVYRSFFRDATVLSLGISVTCLVSAPFVIRVIYGSGFAGAVIALRSLSVWPIFVGLGATFVATLTQTNRDRQVLQAYVVGAGMALAAYAILIKPLGIIGAVLATGCGEVAVMSVSLWNCRRLGIRVPGRVLAMVTAAAAVFAFSLYVGTRIAQDSILLGIIAFAIAIGLYLATLLACRVYSLNSLFSLYRTSA